MTELVCMKQYSDRQDDFKHFRYAVADAVVDACKVIKSETCLRNFWNRMTELLTAQDTSWQSVEAVLYGEKPREGIPNWLARLPMRPSHKVCMVFVQVCAPSRDMSEKTRQNACL